MDQPERPPARFRRFERVEAPGGLEPGPGAGPRGTVVWCDPPCFNRRTGAFAEWAYCVYLPAEGRYRSFRESGLRSTGEHDAVEAYLGRGYEVSFDSVMGDDMNAVEGCYRLPGEFWRVYTFSKADVPELRHAPGEWEGGITGVEFEVPAGTNLNAAYVVGAVAGVLGGGPWVVVPGPDSLVLK